MRSKKFKLVINGEGGGDIYSLLAVVAEVQIMCAQTGRQAKVMYLGARSDYRLILEANAVKVHSILSGGIAGKLFGFVQSLWWLYFFMPDVILSNGGGTASTLISAGRFYFIPAVFHEQNAIPEASDQKTAKRAKTVTLAYASAGEYFPGRLPGQGTGKQESYLVGEPVRSYILPKSSQSPGRAGGEGDADPVFAKRSLNFDVSKPLIFVNGGSAGSPALNQFVVENIPFILQIAQVLHQTGRGYYEGVASRMEEITRDVPQELLKGYKAVDYFEKDIKTAFIASDLVIARSGPSTLAELAAFGKPAILVPAPESVSPTQRYNAGEYAKSGAALVIEEENLLPNMFLSTLRDIMADKEKLSSMAKAASAQFRPRAAADLAEIVLKLARQ